MTVSERVKILCRRASRMEKSGSAIPLFPVVFRKAGFKTFFFDNQKEATDGGDYIRHSAHSVQACIDSHTLL